MKISETIAELQKILNIRGDADLVIQDANKGYEQELDFGYIQEYQDEKVLKRVCIETKAVFIIDELTHHRYNWNKD